MHDPDEGVTPDGMIRTGARPRTYAPEHQGVFERVARDLPAGASLYVYGSVATGTATIPASDIDLVTFGVPAAVANELSRIHSTAAADVCREVAIGPADRAGLQGVDAESYGNRVFLRHYCVHLTGPPVHEDVPDAFPANRAAARGFNGDIARHAAAWKTAIESSNPAPAILGTRIARKTLLAAAGLVSIRDQTWTTDRHRAARAWSSEDPEIGTLLEWLTDPPHQAAQVADALDGLVARVVEAFEEQIGLW